MWTEEEIGADLMDLLMKGALQAHRDSTQYCTLGTQEYARVGETFVAVDDQYEDGYTGCVMRVDNAHIPEIQPSETVQKGIHKVSEHLAKGTEPNYESCPIFDPYDMSRLGGGRKYPGGNYTTAVARELKDCVSVRDPPSWLIGMVRDEKVPGVTKFKIATHDRERYKKERWDIVPPSARDLTLVSSVLPHAVGVFTSPAYARVNNSMEISERIMKDNLVISYYVRGKPLWRYLSRDPAICYETSRVGNEVLLSLPKHRKALVQATFKDTGTEFYFDWEEKDLPRSNARLQYFQHHTPLRPKKRRVGKKSSAFDLISEVEGISGLTFCTDHRLPEGPVDVVLGEDKIYVAITEEVLEYEYGTFFLYSVARKCPNLGLKIIEREGKYEVAIARPREIKVVSPHINNFYEFKEGTGIIPISVIDMQDDLDPWEQKSEKFECEATPLPELEF